ncbi:uncharacterized protein [Venturia canescens]|uniref:uncharacterized protein n=1 Tax=Venturia canescens TaxID=32260 RepID=UPI001C9CC2C1|nr:uncharacterized protein LOC122407460 [Venturia canescens]XP_043269620.1 uncharacterized protein LOC122407460 [Venturia canescens]
MIEKNEQPEEENTDEKRVNFLSQKRTSLQESSLKIQEEVRLCFEQLAKVLRTREKQLMRQVEAIHNQQLSIIQSNQELSWCVPAIQINLSKRQDLEDCILKFGELLSSTGNGIEVKDAEPYKIEDYVEANKDHVTLDKCIDVECCNERMKEISEKLNDSSNSFCELSFNASSEADTTSENEITVLMNHNYSNDFLSPQKTKNQQLLNNSSTWELEVTTQITENLILPGTQRNNDSLMKDDCNNSMINSDKNLCCSIESGSPVETLDANADVSTMRKSQDGEKHPKQIQEWLEQILVETETEPTIHEIEQFAEISKSRFKEFSFPLET